MPEPLLSTALSTLVQVSASLAALIGFLGLWKLDWLRREKDRAELDLRQLTGTATGGGSVDWPGLINRPWPKVLSEAEEIARTPSTDAQREVQPHIAHG